MVPHKTPHIFQKLMPTRVWRIATLEKKLFLTFDDGPITGLTEWVLDVLKEKGVKATFFCVGENIERNPTVFHRIIAEGHAIGNHTHRHLNGWEVSVEEYLEDIEKAQKQLVAQGGQTTLFRPPYGRLSWRQRKQLGTYKIVMWDVLSKDYLLTLEKEEVLAKSISATENGSIIVFHDNVKAEENLRYAMPRYIDHFLELGYHFEVLQ